jgi:succinate dehydrogenase/fumarate reductase flavoprotein subunit
VGVRTTEPTETVEADVVVVGGGGSGLAAAIEAAIHGSKVVVIDKAQTLRGSTGRSVGAIAASRTPDQRRAGISDSPDQHLADYRITSGALAETENDELVRLLVENAADSLAWLRGLGVEFFGPVQGLGHSLPRLHNALPGSRSYIYHLARRARRLGITVLLSTTAERLDRDGKAVVGVLARGADGRELQLRARRSVVLAAGDFSASSEMRRTYINEQVASYLPVNPDASGDAQRMAMAIGAQMLNGNVFDTPTLRLAPPPAKGWFGLLQDLPPRRVLTAPIAWSLRHVPGRLIRPLMLSFVTTYLSPREALFDNGAIFVDRRGTWRAAATDQSMSEVIAGLGEEGGFVVGDRRLFEQFSQGDDFVAMAPGVARAYLPDFRRSRRDVYSEAGSLADLAAKIGVPVAVLKMSIDEANNDSSRRSRPRVDVPPYFALGPIRSHLLQTGGGLRVSPAMEVLTEAGEPIPRLYAAGNAGQGGLTLFGYGHHLGWAFTSGRIAGRNAALATTPTGR